MEDITNQAGNFSLALYLSLIPGCYAPYFTRYYDFDFGPFLFICRPHHGELYFSMPSYVRTTRETYAKLKSYESINELLEVRDFVSVGQEINSLYAHDMAGISSSDTLDLQAKIQIYYDKFWRLLSSSLFSEAVYEDLVKDLYLQSGGQDAQFAEFLQHASSLSFESFVLRQDKALLAYTKNRDLESIVWTYTDYFDALPPARVIERAEERLAEVGGVESMRELIKAREQEAAENKQVCDDFAKGLPSELRKLFVYAQKSMEIRDVRKTGFQSILTLIALTAKELCYRQGISPDLAPYTVFSDWPTGRYAEADFGSELEKRKNCVIYFEITGPRFEFSDPGAAARHMDDVILPSSQQTMSQVSGQPACRGSAQGQARIVLSQSDFNKFQDGDVLVTSMTRPEFLPLMKKAVAIVTDEGGITCHAAIVSRELGIPCVIGTKVATKVFKDGDVLKIDAHKGEITKI